MYSYHVWDPTDVASTLDIVRLLNSRLSGSMDARTFRWKHVNNPFGPSIILFARHVASGDMASVRALWRWNLLFEGKELAAGQPCDTATSSKHEKHGLFTELNRRALAEAQREGLQVLFNFPRPGVMSGALRMGWTDMGGLYSAISVLRPTQLAFRAIRSTRAPRRRQHTSSGSTTSVNWASASYAEPPSTDRVMGNRDVVTLAWRLASRPHRNYQVVDVGGNMYVFGLATIGHVQEATLMDVLGVHGDWDAVSTHLRTAARSTGSDVLRVLLSRGHPLVGRLPRWTFLPLRSRANFVVHDLANTGIARRTWHITPVDIDTF